MRMLTSIIKVEVQFRIVIIRFVVSSERVLLIREIKLFDLETILEAFSNSCFTCRSICEEEWHTADTPLFLYRFS